MDTKIFTGSVTILGSIGLVVSVLGLFFVVFIVWATKLFNKLIKLRALKEEGWSGVLTTLKRRRDLIPIILKTAESYVVTPESETLRNITRAYAQEQAARGVAETARAEAGMTAALVGFGAIMQSNSDLKADTSMVQILEDLSKLQERIELTRHYYNATVRDYNMEMGQFPASLIFGLLNFRRAILFETHELPQE